MKICNILVDANVNNLFTYIIPDHLDKEIKIGSYVKIPFGKTTRKGIVIDISNEKKPNNLKSIISLIHNIPLVNNNSIKLIEFTKDYFLQSIGKFSSKIGFNSLPLYEYFLIPGNIPPITKRQKIIISLIGNRIMKHKAADFASNEIIKRMLKNNVLIENKSIHLYQEYNDLESEFIFSHKKDSTFNVSTRKQINFIEDNIMLYDRIEKIIKTTLKENKRIIIIIPELNSHKYLISYLLKMFTNDLIIYSSSQKPSKQRIAYYNIILSKSKIVLGTSDVLFLPHNNLGNIIFLSSESPYYNKYSNTPFYNAEIIVFKFAEFYKIPLYIFGKTPSINTYLAIQRKKADHLKSKANRIKIRYFHNEKPFSILTRPIINILKDSINSSKILILYNIKGYYSLVRCNTCKKLLSCPICNKPLMYLKNKKIYYCSKCKRNFKIKRCLNCGSNNFYFSSPGTEKLTSSLEQEFHISAIKEISADNSSNLDLLALKENNIIISTSYLYKDLYPLSFDKIIVPSIESFIYETSLFTENSFMRMLFYMMKFVKENGEFIIQSNYYYDFLPYLENNNFIKYITSQLNIRYNLKLYPYYHLIEIYFTHNNKDNINKYYNLISENIIIGDHIRMSNNKIIIKCKKVINYIFLRDIIKTSSLRIKVDPPEYL